MQTHRLSACIKVYRPLFVTVSIAPVLIGFAAGCAVTSSFKARLFVLAGLAMVFLHLGANAANEYFDYISGNDAYGSNYSIFSGGSKCIQKGLIAPKQVLLQGWIALMVGAGLGVVIVLITGSFIILVLGIIGLFGGYFYTAPPLKIGYRGFGELLIMFLFGIFPVFGSYYLQTSQLDIFVLLPALLVGGLVFLIILINEFPDHQADAAVNKETLVVKMGFPRAILIYKIALSMTYLLAGLMLLIDVTFWAGLLYLLILPLGFYIFKSVDVNRVQQVNDFLPNKLTLLLHSLGCTALISGFLVTGFLA